MNFNDPTGHFAVTAVRVLGDYGENGSEGLSATKEDNPVNDAENKNKPLLTVYIQEKVKLTEAEENAMKLKTAEVFATAGVNVEFKSGKEWKPEMASNPSVKLLILQDAPKGTSGSKGGLTIQPEGGGTTNFVKVWVDRTVGFIKLDKDKITPEMKGKALGLAAAHKLGHSLGLGHYGGEYGPLNIMMPKHEKEFWRGEGTKWEESFTKKDAERIRKELGGGE